MPNGYTLTGAQASSQTWRAAFLGEYAEEAVGALAPFVLPNTVLLDIGGSMGFFAVPAAIMSRAQGARCVVYEPVPRNMDLIRRNVHQNGLSETVDLRPVGLSAEPATMTMEVEGRGVGNASITSGVSQKELSKHRIGGIRKNEVQVRVETLDHDAFEHPCSAIKIDVEGFELEVLRGGEKFIQTNRPAIYAEFNTDWLASRGERRNAPMEWTKDHDYVAFGYPATRRRPWLERESTKAVEMGGSWHPGDVLLVPRERLGEMQKPNRPEQ